jgi:hypothetical protein
MIKDEIKILGKQHAPYNNRTERLCKVNNYYNEKIQFFNNENFKLKSELKKIIYENNYLTKYD